MSFPDLDLLNDEVLVNSFQSALGDDGPRFEVEIRQVATLIRNKLEQFRSYYQAAQSQRDSELQRDLLGRSAARASHFVTVEQDRVEQISAVQQFFDEKMRAYSHIGLQVVIQEARAFEYLTLTDLDPSIIDFERLRRSRMSGSEYQRFVSEAETLIQTEFIRAASLFTNAGETLFAGVSFELSELPTAREHFVQTGQITLSIPLPEESNFYGVTFSDVRVFLVDLPASGRSPVTIDLVKAGVSDFKDQTGGVRRFTHDESNPPTRFVYDADRCTVMSSSDGQLQSGNMQDVYIRYSPYGTWNLEVASHSDLQLDAVTAVYFEFRLQAKAGRFPGTSVFFTGGSIGELGEAACDEHGSSTTRPPPPPPPAPAPAGEVSCASYPEFMPRMQAVGSACCGDADAPCDSNGVPTTCTASCAEVLLPMQSACAGFLVVLGMRASIDAAAAMCPAATPAIPCTNFGEFGPASQAVTDVCCDDAAHPCVGGLPTACTRACSEVLPTFHAACYDFLGTIGMQTTVDSALATCTGLGGH